MKNGNGKQTPIVVKNLKKSFGRQRVLNGIHLAVREGETVAVLGGSGTGKSVLLKLLIGLQQPDSGSVRIHDQEISGLEPKALNELRKKMGFLFQQGALYDSLTVAENVAFPLERHTSMTEGERKKRVRELLRNVGMDRDLEKMPSEISGGMQKRVGLARALALDPDVLLFDEPTTGLDPITGGEIARLILDLKERQKITAVVVTHDIHAARVFADRMLLMRNGEFLVEGTFADLKKSKDEYVAQFLSEAC